MADVEIQVGADTRGGKENLKAFEADFEKFLASLGRSPDEIKAIRKIADDLAAQRVQLVQLPPEVAKLVSQYQQLSGLAKARDALNLIPHEELKSRIAQVCAAFDLLKASGKLTNVEIAQAALKTQERISDLERSTNGWFEALSKAKTELATLGARGAGLGLAINEAIEFESAMADVKKVVEATPEEFAQLTSRVKALANELPLAAKELAQIAAAGGQLGVASKDIDQFVTLTAKLATAFNLTADVAGTSIAKLANVFNLPIAKVEELGDSINVLGNTTAAREADIIEALTRIGGTATQFGLATDAAAALAATLISLGSAPEVAARAINTLLSKLQTAPVQTEKFQGALEQLGFQADDLAARIKANPQEALNQFLRTLEKLDGQARAEALTQLFGEGFQDDIAKLVGGLGQYEQSLARVSDKSAVAGSVEREYQERLKTTEAQLKLLSNSVNNAAIALGSVFLPAVNDIASGLKTGAEAVTGFVETFPELAAGGALLLTLVGSVAALKTALLAVELVSAKAGAGIADNFRNANQPIGEATQSLGKLGVAFNLLGAALVGYDIGKYFFEQSVAVRKAGLAITETLVLGGEQARYYAEVVAAAFSGDTIEAAEKRHLARLDEIEANLRATREEAERTGFTFKESSEKAAGAADTQSESQKRLKVTVDQTGAAYQQTGAAARAELDKTTEKVKDAAAEAAQLLGLDFGRLTTGISAEITKIAEGLRTLAEDSRVPAEGLFQAFEAAFKKANTSKELALLRTVMAEVFIPAQSELGRYNALLAESAVRVQQLTLVEQQASTSAGKFAADAAQYMRDLIASSDARLAKIREEEIQLRKNAQAEFDKGEAATEAGRKAHEAAENSVSVSVQLSNELNGIIQGYRNISDAAGDVARDIIVNNSNFGNSFEIFFSRIAYGLNRLNTDLLDQQARADSLINAYNNGTISLGAFRRQAMAAVDSMGLLNDQQLGALRSAIEEVNREFERLNESARNSLNSLLDERDRLAGRDDLVDQRRTQQQIEELRAQLRRANQIGDAQAARDLERAIALATANANTRDQQRRDSEGSSGNNGKPSGGGGRPPSTTPSTPAADPQRDTFSVTDTRSTTGNFGTLNFNIGGNNVPVTTSQQNAQALLDALAQAQATANAANTYGGG